MAKKFLHKTCILLVVLSVLSAFGVSTGEDAPRSKPGSLDLKLATMVYKSLSDVKTEQFSTLAALNKLVTTVEELKKGQAELASGQAASLSKLKQEHNSTLYEIKKIIELKAPKRCYKGMSNTLFNKYYFLQPSIGDVMKKPYQCDTETDGGGWIVIFRRTNGTFDFDRTWEEYKVGFGDIYNFWLGNDDIHAITNSGVYEMRIDLRAPTKSPAHFIYTNFTVASEEKNYKMFFDYSTNSHFKSLFFQSKDDQFSTKDRDNDRADSKHCARETGGGWWYYQCLHSVGAMLTRKLPSQGGERVPTWPGYDDADHIVNYAEMKIRRTG